MACEGPSSGTENGAGSAANRSRGRAGRPLPSGGGHGILESLRFEKTLKDHRLVPRSTERGPQEPRRAANTEAGPVRVCRAPRGGARHDAARTFAAGRHRRPGRRRPGAREGLSARSAAGGRAPTPDRGAAERWGDCRRAAVKTRARYRAPTQGGAAPGPRAAPLPAAGRAAGLRQRAPLSPLFPPPPPSGWAPAAGGKRAGRACAVPGARRQRRWLRSDGWI
ncbi:protein FAM246C-like [Tympanuchus pallidicinctus]|uniref:protein FAM246C-like n=1 Tax=Tympanuchus pallidicinctus TaxID=109042 RepID=UPI0022873A84|nr:protein FAM246C-like [Tympanuchus pallidicinctus]